jgi:hypothetical protein
VDAPTCYVCLLDQVARPAAADTLVGGTAVCAAHLARVINADVLGTTAPL